MREHNARTLEAAEAAAAMEAASLMMVAPDEGFGDMEDMHDGLHGGLHDGSLYDGGLHGDGVVPDGMDPNALPGYGNTVSGLADSEPPSVHMARMQLQQYRDAHQHRNHASASMEHASMVHGQGLYQQQQLMSMDSGGISGPPTWGGQAVNMPGQQNNSTQMAGAGAGMNEGYRMHKQGHASEYDI